MKKRNPHAKTDALIDRIWNEECKGVQVNILDIGKIFDAGRHAAATGEDIRAAVLAKTAELRLN